MYCIAITGSIASGKSSVASCFKQLGIDVISADYTARKLTDVGQPALNSIRQHFGERIVNEKGELNRSLLRELIFNNRDERLWLENLLHPLIRQALEYEVLRCSSPYCMVEIPLLKSKADYPYVNRVLAVLSDSDEDQIARLVERDSSTREHALSILHNQPTREEYLAIADDHIINNGSLKELEGKILVLHSGYLAQAKKR